MTLLEESPRPDLESLISVDPRIRFAVLVDPKGNPKEYASRLGCESLEPERESRLYFEQAVIGTDMASVANRFHGALRMVVVQREKVMIMVFAIYDGLVIVSAEPDLPLEEAAEVGRRLDMPGMRPRDPDAPQTRATGPRQSGDLR